MGTTITRLELENVKRIRAFALEPSPTGLTVIGGKNGQGKTSVLDAIAWALGGERYRPSDATREGSAIPPHIKLTLSNGIVVERSGKNSSLKVTDPSGRSSGQTLLNAFISQFALNLPGFLLLSGKDKANELLRMAGIGDALLKLDHDEKSAYNERLAIGRIADQKRKAVEEMPTYSGVPDDLISPSRLTGELQAALQRNAENARIRANYGILRKRLEDLETETARLIAERDELRQQLTAAETGMNELQDLDTRAIEEAIQDMERINAQIRANLDKARAADEANAYAKQYGDLTVQIEAIRAEKLHLLEGADLPLEGLTVADGELVYKGQKWDCMSGAEQLMVATAIASAERPECGFVLLDKLEQMDTDTLAAFGEWLRGKGLQAIATRVSTGGECAILIEDGMAIAQSAVEAPAPQPPRKWVAGQF